MSYIDFASKIFEKLITLVVLHIWYSESRKRTEVTKVGLREMNWEVWRQKVQGWISVHCWT